MKGTVIFDFDGVVIQSREVQIYALKKCYEHLYDKRREPDYETFFQNSGDSLLNIFKIMKLPLEAVEIYQKFSSEKVKDIKVYSGIKKILYKLRKNGYTCGLCTGKDRRRTFEILTAKDLLKYFDIVVCSDDVVNAKPAADSLKLVMNELNADKDNTVMVGDGINDILAAKAAGIPVIAVAWGDSPIVRLKELNPDAVAYKVNDITEQIEQVLKKSSHKKTFLVNDFVVQEECCNLKCEYCLTKTSVLQKDSGRLKGLSYNDDSILKKNMDTTIEKLRSAYKIGILKLSGGEIFLVKGILTFIRQEAKHHAAIQILTNGTLLTDEILKELKDIGNVCIQLSIDHHTIEGNNYRTDNKIRHEAILSAIEKITQYKIPLEINCVLTDKNTNVLENFTEYLLRYKNSNLMLMPFPVRGKDSNKYLPLEKQYPAIRMLLNNYEKYQEILAPKIYLSELYNYLQTKKRNITCHVPEAAIGTFDDGRVTPCPNYWFTALGKLTGEEAHTVLSRIGTDKMYNILRFSQNKITECRQCFTPWDIINLYIEDKLSYDELIKAPLYSIKGVEEYLISIKEKGKFYEHVT